MRNDAAAAHAAYERALLALRTYRGDPVAPLDEAIALAPDFAAAHVAKALILMTFFERRFARDALQALDAGAPALARAGAREKGLAAAARLLATSTSAILSAMRWTASWSKTRATSSPSRSPT